jgi:hypothetical protein
MSNLDPRARLAGLALCLLALTACDSGAGSGASASPSPSAGAPLQVLVVSAASDQCAPCLVAGKDRRLSLAVTDRDGVPVAGVSLSAQLFSVPAGAAPPQPLGPAVEVAYKGDLLQDKGVYVLHHTFETPGIYRVVAQARKGAVAARSEANFQVIATDPGISVGAPAPLTRQPLQGQVADISTIDTGVPPDDMHYITVADAVAAHHAVVIYFGSPGFCQSKTCGPEVDVVRALEARYRARGVDFVHIETYKGGRPDANRTISPEFDQWKLTTDPWVCVVDRQGVVSAKFDGPTTADEIDPFVAALAG